MESEPKMRFSGAETEIIAEWKVRLFLNVNRRKTSLAVTHQAAGWLGLLLISIDSKIYQ